jgi:organic radical activating enzyme
MKSIFDWLKAINTTKPPVESFTNKDWEVWNSYMIHRFLSMDCSNIELVNEIQEILPTDKKKIYSIYKEFIPKNNKWNKYIKSKIKQPNKDLINYIKDYYECSSKEAKEYINLLGSVEINRILHDMGLDKKEIKSLLK